MKWNILMAFTFFLFIFVWKREERKTNSLKMKTQYQGEKSKVPNWAGVAKGVAGFWSSPPHPDAFVSFPASAEDDVHHVC